MLFALFCILSLLLHLGVLVAFAGNLKMQRISSENMENQDPIQVSTVRMPPPAPESPPPESEAPPTPPRPPAQPDAFSRPRPVATPTPKPSPTPVLAKPQTTPTPALATASPAPVASPTPRPSATPETALSPSPQATPSEHLPPAEAQAKQSIQDFMKAQGTDVPDTLPQGFKSWEEYQKFLISFDENAARLMVLPGNTDGSEQAGSGPATPAAPATSSPENEGGARTGQRSGLFDRLFNNNESPQSFDTRATENELESGQARLRDLTRLELPEASPPPLPEKWETGSLGFSYVKFSYDQLRFQARWDSAVQPAVRTVDVSYYSPAAPKEIRSFRLQWQEAWNEQIKDLISAVQIVYEQQKKAVQP